MIKYTKFRRIIMITLITCLIGGLGAGIGTGLAGLSAAAVISPMLITFLGMPAYQAVGIALASDVLASAVSAYTYGKNKNLDIKNGMIMMITVLIFTMVGSYISSLVPNKMMGNFSVYMTFLVGLKFIIKPVMTTKDDMEEKSVKTKIIQSILCGIMIGFICGFVGAGGGMMLLFLTAAAQHFLAGGFLPLVFLPGAVRKLAPFLPSGILMDVMKTAVSGVWNFSAVFRLILMFAVFFAGSCALEVREK